MLKFYQVDAFTHRLFAGNPAGVVILEQELEDATMLAIAAENNLAETAFLHSSGGVHRLRWFTPKLEVDLCGHATLATGHVLFEHEGWPGDAIDFETLSGRLTVRRQGDMLALDFPSRPPQPASAPEGLMEAMGAAPQQVLAARDLLLLYEDEAQVVALAPRFDLLARVDTFAVIATAPGRDADFVSRFFAPRAGIDEDPVTGSAHCTLAPYWAARLGKPRLAARQLSQRGGQLVCEVHGDRVSISGRAVLYLEGRIATG